MSPDSRSTLPAVNTSSQRAADYYTAVAHATVSFISECLPPWIKRLQVLAYEVSWVQSSSESRTCVTVNERKK